MRTYLNEKADKLKDYEEITDSYCTAKLRNYHRRDPQRISKIPHVTFVRGDYPGDKRCFEISMIKRGG